MFPTLRPECIPCILRVREREIRRCVEGEEAEKIVGELRRHVYSSSYIRIDELAYSTHRLIKTLTGCGDPERDVKDRHNRFYLNLLPKLLEQLGRHKGYSLFRLAVAASINGNALDVGTIYFSSSPEKVALKLFDDRLAVDHTPQAYELLRQSRSAAILLDNAGEAVIDMALASVLRGMGLRVTAIVKGGPYQNDITYKEFLELGLAKYVDAVLSTESDAPSIMEKYVPRGVVQRIWLHDIVIAKGMAHLETLYHSNNPRPVFFLFVAKCKPNADRVGVSVGDKVALLKMGDG